MAGATTLGDLAGAIGARIEESAVIAELKGGSEEAYAWLIGEFHQPIYGLIYRIVNDPSDAADTTQEVFLKVFRGMKHFHGESSLKTWIYRIALHEASNRRRWWFRHKAQETSIEPAETGEGQYPGEERLVDRGESPFDQFAHAEVRAVVEVALTHVHKAQETSIEPVETGENQYPGEERLVDRGESPFDQFAHTEVRVVVEEALTHVPEPYRTAIILRDLEEMSYEEVAEVLQISLGTVKSRITRGRDALRKKLAKYVREVGPELGLVVPASQGAPELNRSSSGGRELEVTP